MKILLGLTGSVASVLYRKLIAELQTIGEVEVILTGKAENFIEGGLGELTELTRPKGWKGEPVQTVWRDVDEWEWQDSPKSLIHLHNVWKKNDRVLHIELRDRASALVIAPCSANTLAKISGGFCDNLLTSVVRAWDFNRPLIIAPAMNTHMWNNPLTREHLNRFSTIGQNNFWVKPQSKMLACKTEGMGALAEVSEIVKFTQERLRWSFPLREPLNLDPKCNGIPQPGHPGAFLTKRKNHTHTGVDLYTTDGQAVYAVESGQVVSIEDFTGQSQQTPWWEETQCILIEGASGVVCYGEISVAADMKLGKNVARGEYIGKVKRVLKLGKERPDIDGHSTSMLHMEIYKHGVYRSFEENPNIGPLSDWNDLIDPTPFLMNARNRPEKLLH